MRKSKEFKRMRREAGIEYRRGNRKEAYKLWTESAKGYHDRLAAIHSKRAPRKPVEEAAPAAPAET